MHQKTRGYDEEEGYDEFRDALSHFLELETLLINTIRQSNL